MSHFDPTIAEVEAFYRERFGGDFESVEAAPRIEEVITDDPGYTSDSEMMTMMAPNLICAPQWMDFVWTRKEEGDPS